MRGMYLSGLISGSYQTAVTWKSSSAGLTGNVQELSNHPFVSMQLTLLCLKLAGGAKTTRHVLSPIGTKMS